MLAKKTVKWIELKHLLDSLLLAGSIERWANENSKAFFNTAIEILNADDLSFSLNMMRRIDMQWLKEKRKREICTYTWKKNNKVMGFQGRNVIEMREYHITKDDNLVSDGYKILELRFFFGMLRYALTREFYPAEYNNWKFETSTEADKRVRFLRKDEIPRFYTRFMDLMIQLMGKELVKEC